MKKTLLALLSLPFAWLLKLGALPLIGSLEKRRIQNAATASTIDLNHEDWYYLLQQAI